MTASLAQEGPKDRLDMASRQPVWARDGFKTAGLSQEDGSKTAKLGQGGPKDRLETTRTKRLEMASRQPVWARNGFKTANLGQEGAKDRLEMVPRQLSWAKKVPRIG